MYGGGGGGYPPGGGPPGYPPGGAPPGYPPAGTPGYPQAPQGNPYAAPPMYAPGVAPAPFGAPAQGFGMVPHAPYGVDPATGLPFSDKEKVSAGLLNIFLPGVGRMYMGHVGLGVAQMLVTIFTCVGYLWPLIDGISILSGGARDVDGRPLRG